MCIAAPDVGPLVDEQKDGQIGHVIIHYRMIVVQMTG